MYLGIGFAGLLGSAFIRVTGLDGLGPFGAAMALLGLLITVRWYSPPRAMPRRDEKPRPLR
jgi:predicted MFS family arabinose efflux permease